VNPNSCGALQVHATLKGPPAEAHPHSATPIRTWPSGSDNPRCNPRCFGEMCWMNVQVDFSCDFGDQGHSSREKSFFQSWYQILCGHGFDNALTLVRVQGNVPLLDCLPLGKSARSRLVRDRICLDASSLRSKIVAMSVEAFSISVTLSLINRRSGLCATPRNQALRNDPSVEWIWSPLIAGV
jgi:hypothetical protein